MCTKTWRWFHVTMVFFVFIASLFLATIAAVSKITHTTWKREAAKKEIQLAELKRQFQAMSRGVRDQQPVVDADELRADDIPDNMFDVRSKLTRVMMDRGRVWRGASVQNVTGNADWKRVEIKLGTVENPNQIQGAGTVLYAFKETLAPDEVEPVAGDDDLEEEIPDDPAATAAPVKVPVVYMGEFRVVNVGPADVTLSWTYAPTRMQRIHMGFADKTSWVLYEKMPVDGHQLFSYQIVNDIELDDKDPGTPARNEEDIRPLFGKMSPAELQQLFKMVAGETFSFNQGQIVNLFGQLVNNTYPNAGNQWTTERGAYAQSLVGSYPNRDNPAMNSFLQSALRNYLRDGYRAEENEPEANVWVKVRFKKSLKLPADEVDGDSPQEGVDDAWKGLDKKFFDTQGKALSGRLRRDEPVEFDENQLAFFHKGDLSDDLEHLDRYKKLEADGTIERLFDIYVRPLNDYEFRFHNFFQKEVYLLQRIGRSQRELTLLAGANTKTQAEIAYRTQEKQKLVDDLAKHQRDVTVLEDYVAQLETQKAGLRQELGRVFQANQQLANQLVEINRRLTEEIDRRTNAVGSSP
ncbi:MAG TPA: hypothetical protein EYN70_15045 [Planctomycetaceae bacterium]|nr:hypothetical protein [Planctomycetaceae bacterium]